MRLTRSPQAALLSTGLRGIRLRRIVAALGLAFVLGGASHLLAADDLSPLSDEFGQTSTKASCLRVVHTEGWGNDVLERLSRDGERPGWLRLVPHTSSWYGEWRGELMYQAVTGDFVVTTEVEPRNRTGTGAPGSLYSLAGLTVYTDWPLCESVGSPWHNTHVLTNGAPAPGGGTLSGANPDLQADFDFVRYARPIVPPVLAGAALSDPSQVSDAQLLSFLGDHANPAPSIDPDPDPNPGPGPGPGPVILSGADVVLSTTVIAPKPERFGFNLLASLVNNHTLDPGFEPTLLRHVFVATGGGEGFIENNAGPTSSFFQTLTNGFFNGANARIYRPQAAGPMSLLRRATVTNDAVHEHRVYLDTPGPAVQAGDYYFLEFLATDPPRDRLDPRMLAAAGGDPWRPVGGAVWPFGLPVESDRDDTTMAPEVGGRSSVRLTSPGSHEVTLRQARFSSPERYGAFYPQLIEGRRYRMEVWLRQTGIPDGSARVFLTQHYQSVSNRFEVGAEWRKHEFTFVAPPTPPRTEGISEVCLGFTGPGTLWADNLFLYEDDDLNPATYPVFSPDSEAEAAMASFQPGPIRLWAGQANTTWGTSLESLTATEPVRPVAWHTDQGKVPAEFAFPLPVALPLVQRTGGTPWIIISPAFDESEWLGLIEYLAAPFDPSVDSVAEKPWASLRHRQGRTEPWTGAFDRVRIEFGNEAWNNSFQFIFPTGDLMGQFANHFFEVARSSPWFPAVADRIDFIVNGWILQTGAGGYGHAAVQRTPNARFSDITAYLSGWELGSNFGSNVTDVAFQDMLLFPAGWLRHFVDQHAATRDALAVGRDYRLAVYEGGPGYPLPGPGSEFHPVAETYGKSLAGATATLDAFLYNSSRRIDPQAFFGLAPGPNWTSHTNTGSSWRAHAVWQALELRNRHARGDMLNVAILRAPTVDIPAVDFGGNAVPAFPNTPLLAAYAFRDGERYSVFLLSRSLTGHIPVTLHLPFTNATQVTLHFLTGDPRTNNISGPTLGVSRTILPDFQPGTPFNLPPGSVALLVFENASTPENSAPSVTISVAPGQPDPTPDAFARFRVHFSQPVAGFEPDDLQVTAPGATQARVRLEELPPHLGTDYEVTISDWIGLGDVLLNIPVGAVTNLLGAPNTAVRLLDHRVTQTAQVVENRLFAHDDFGIPPSASPTPPYLQGVQTGTGWLGPWSVQNFDTTYAGGYRLSEAVPMTSGNLLVTGSHAIGGRRYETASRSIAVPTALSGFEVPGVDPAVVGRTGRTLWFSAIIRKDTPQWNAEGPTILMVNDALAWNFNAIRLAFGYFGNASVQAGTAYWSLAVRNTADNGFDVVRSNIPIGLGETVLLVARIEFGLVDRVDLFVNPASLGGVPPSTPNVSWTASPSHPDVVFRTIGLYGGPSGVAGVVEGSFDEIRFGDSFAAVTPVAPDPDHNATWPSWRTSHPWPNAASSELDADPDADGSRNLEEYARGTDPLAPSDSAGLSAAVVNGRLEFSLDLDVRAVDVRCEVEFSEDMAQWESVITFRPQGTTLLRESTGVTEAIRETRVGFIARVTERETGTASDRAHRFVRLRYALP